jgi:hypothetical protein
VRWAQWVRTGILPRLSPTARDVAMVLAAFGSREGRAFPSSATIKRLTGHRRDTIFKALKDLVGLGIIERQGYVKRRGMNARGPSIYSFHRPPAESPGVTDTLSDGVAKGVSDTPSNSAAAMGTPERDGCLTGTSPSEGDWGGPSGAYPEGQVLEGQRTQVQEHKSEEVAL